jgi:hypothetical protein
MPPLWRLADFGDEEQDMDVAKIIAEIFKLLQNEPELIAQAIKVLTNPDTLKLIEMIAARGKK